MDNAIYFAIKNDELATASELFKENTSKILKAAQNSFEKANTQKWRLKFPGGQPTLIDLETKKPIDYSEYKKKITEGLLSEEEAIVLLSETFDLVNLNKDNDKNLTDFSNTVKQTSIKIFWDGKSIKIFTYGKSSSFLELILIPFNSFISTSLFLAI